MKALASYIGKLTVVNVYRLLTAAKRVYLFEYPATSVILKPEGSITPGEIRMNSHVTQQFSFQQERKDCNPEKSRTITAKTTLPNKFYNQKQRPAIACDTIHLPKQFFIYYLLRMPSIGIFLDRQGEISVQSYPKPTPSSVVVNTKLKKYRLTATRDLHTQECAGMFPTSRRYSLLGRMKMKLISLSLNLKC